MPRRLSIITVLAFAASIGLAQAQFANAPGSPPGHLPPNWVLKPTPAIDFNFAKGLFYQQGRRGPAANFLTTSRASVGYIDDLSGNWTSVASNVARISNKGLLVEEARTNSIRNNSMQGAVVGTPGTLPTNWSIVGVPAGVSTTINSIGTQNGVDIISITFSGTNTSGSTAFPSVSFEASAVTAASQNQVWAPAGFIQTSGANQLNWGLRVREFNASGTFLTQGGRLDVNTYPTFSRMADSSYTVSNAATAFINYGYDSGSLVNGAAWNQTLIIGWPQLELGAFATSPIRTANAAVTRAADLVTVTKAPSFGGAYTLFGKGAPNAPVAYSNNQIFLAVDDGTGNNQSRITRGNAAGFPTMVMKIAGSTVVNVGQPASWTADSKIAMAIAPSSQVFYVNGSLGNSATNSSTAAVSAVSIGGQSVSGGFQFNGYVERFALWPTTGLPNSTLQSLTQ